MSTASTSVAQFMAILSGGTNPSMLRQNLASNPNGELDFAGLLNSSGQLTSEGQALLNARTGQLMSGDLTAQVAGGLTVEQLQSLAAIEESQGDAGAQILQFIRQQASIDGENTIVLNLSEKGLSQDIIDELQSMFSTNDLITILKDPNLNAQLDSELQNLTAGSVETHEMASIIGGLLNQNSVTSSGGVTLSADELHVAEDVLKELLDDANLDQTVEVSLQSVSLVETNQPLHLALLQQQMVGGTDDQALTSLMGAKNPFSLKDGAGLTAEMKAMLEQQRPGQTTVGGSQTASGVESIADRLAGITGGNNSNGGASQPNGFPEFVFSTGCEALKNGDGEYGLPFEASFKTASQAANPLTGQSHAAQSHPTTQMVAANLSKMASRAQNGEEVQSYRLQLDPPEMGRLDIEMDFVDSTGQLKAVINVEKPETLSLLQRDMHALLKAMQDAGFEGMSQNDLSFNLSQGQENAFGERNQFGNGSDSHANNQAANDDGDMVIIDAQMSVIIDPVTGQKHINMMV